MDWVRTLEQPEKELRALRRKHVRPTHEIRGMYFAGLFEALDRHKVVVPPTLSPQRARSEKFSPLGKQSLAAFLDLQGECAELLIPQFGSLELAVACLGGNAIEKFFSSFAGRTFRALAGFDPHMILGAGPNAYGVSVLDDSRRSYRSTGPSSGIFRFENDCLGPCHHAGLLGSALRGYGLQPKLSIEARSPIDFDVVLAW